MPLPHSALVLVADGRKMLFFRNHGDEDLIDLRTEAHDARADRKDQEPRTDAPGTVQQSFGYGHSTYEEADFQQQEEDRWIKDAAEQLKKRALRNDFSALAIVAPPKALGYLKKTLHKEVQRRIVCTINKEMSSRPIPDIEALLAAEMRPSFQTSEPRQIYTIGHSTRTIAEFVDLLRIGSVELVIDVRTVPRSRTNPQYNSEVLAGELAPFQIGYQRIAELGGLRGRSRTVPPRSTACGRTRVSTITPTMRFLNSSSAASTNSCPSRSIGGPRSCARRPSGGAAIARIITDHLLARVHDGHSPDGQRASGGRDLDSAAQRSGTDAWSIPLRMIGIAARAGTGGGGRGSDAR